MFRVRVGSNRRDPRKELYASVVRNSRVGLGQLLPRKAKEDGNLKSGTALPPMFWKRSPQGSGTTTSALTKDLTKVAVSPGHALPFHGASLVNPTPLASSSRPKRKALEAIYQLWHNTRPQHRPRCVTTSLKTVRGVQLRAKQPTSKSPPGLSPLRELVSLYPPPSTSMMLHSAGHLAPLGPPDLLRETCSPKRYRCFSNTSGLKS